MFEGAPHHARSSSQPGRIRRSSPGPAPNAADSCGLKAARDRWPHHFHSGPASHVETGCRVVLAYSGGLDIRIILKWLQTEYGAEVVTFTADLGQGGELEPARQKAEIASSTSDTWRVNFGNPYANTY